MRRDDERTPEEKSELARQLDAQGTKHMSTKAEQKDAILKELLALLIHGDDRLSLEYQRELRKRLVVLLAE